jgi:hypothetical protein
VLKLVYADSEVESLDLSGDVRPTSTMDAV